MPRCPFHLSAFQSIARTGWVSRSRRYATRFLHCPTSLTAGRLHVIGRFRHKSSCGRTWKLNVVELVSLLTLSYHISVPCREKRAKYRNFRNSRCKISISPSHRCLCQYVYLRTMYPPLQFRLTSSRWPLQERYQLTAHCPMLQMLI